MREYKIAVMWKETSVVDQEAKTLDQAIKKVQAKFIKENEPPQFGDFVEHSLEVDAKTSLLLNRIKEEKKDEVEDEPEKKEEN